MSGRILEQPWKVYDFVRILGRLLLFSGACWPFHEELVICRVGEYRVDVFERLVALDLVLRDNSRVVFASLRRVVSAAPLDQVVYQ